MAVKSGKYTEEQLNAILKEFKTAIDCYTFTPLTAGFINDTFLVSTSSEKPKYILQRINQTIFENIEGLMVNVQQALKYLKANNYAQIKLIPALSGKTYTVHSTGYWRIMTYLPDSTTYDITSDPEIAFEAGSIIAKFHNLLGQESPKDYKDTIPKFHDLELRKMQFLAALARASKEKKEIAGKAITFSQAMFLKLAALKMEQLPQRVCHNDTKLNNILFSKETKKALCLIDLDTIMRGYFHYDFGDAVRTIVNTAPEDEQEHSKITFEKNLFEAFVNGLSSNDPFLTRAEIGALPYGVILMPFLHGMRALTDYLNNNMYYKVSYENQNLDRALSLFDFANKAMQQGKYMEQTLEQALHPLD